MLSFLPLDVKCSSYDDDGSDGDAAGHGVEVEGVDYRLEFWEPCFQTEDVVADDEADFF